jgi:hypothetical protein
VHAFLTVRDFARGGSGLVSEMFPLLGKLSALSLQSDVSSSAFGPDYWLARCDGFQVVALDGRRGVVMEIVKIDGAIEELRIDLDGDDVRVRPAGVLDIDPVERVLVVDRVGRE